MQARQQLIEKLDYVIKEKTILSEQENTQQKTQEKAQRRAVSLRKKLYKNSTSHDSRAMGAIKLPSQSNL